MNRNVEGIIWFFRTPIFILQLCYLEFVLHSFPDTNSFYGDGRYLWQYAVECVSQWRGHPGCWAFSFAFILFFLPWGRELKDRPRWVYIANANGTQTDMTEPWELHFGNIQFCDSALPVWLLIWTKYRDNDITSYTDLKCKGFTYACTI